MATQKELILVVDDEPKIRTLVGSALQDSGYEVILAENGLEAMRHVQNVGRKPDLIILDLMMPVMDGKEFLAKLRVFSVLPVIMLTASDASADKVGTLTLGADDYVCKPFEMKELLARIQAVLRRLQQTSKVHQDNVLENDGLKLNQDAHTVHYEGQLLPITEREFKLLTILMNNLGRVVKHKDLLVPIWGAEYSEEVRYLRVAFTHIRKKLIDAGADADLISAYSGVGYVMFDKSH